MNSRCLALFDFDGTITSKDSLPDFIQYAAGNRAYYFGLIKMSPLLFSYVLKLTPNNVAKEKLVSHFFKGWDINRFQSISDSYSACQIDKITRKKAMDKIHWHQSRGDTVVVVTASIECWLYKWCEKYQVDLIGTLLEVKDGKLTGRFLSKNCYGKEKVARIKRKYSLSEYCQVYAYGDSQGDNEMLALAHKPHYRIFN